MSSWPDGPPLDRREVIDAGPQERIPEEAVDVDGVVADVALAEGAPVRAAERGVALPEQALQLGAPAAPVDRRLQPAASLGQLLTKIRVQRGRHGPLLPPRVDLR